MKAAPDGAGLHDYAAGLRACRVINAFRSYIQPKFSSYAERRKFIRDEFQAL